MSKPRTPGSHLPLGACHPEGPSAPPSELPQQPQGVSPPGASPQGETWGGGGAVCRHLCCRDPWGQNGFSNKGTGSRCFQRGGARGPPRAAFLVNLLHAGGTGSSPAEAREDLLPWVPTHPTPITSLCLCDSARPRHRRWGQAKSCPPHCSSLQGAQAKSPTASGASRPTGSSQNVVFSLVSSNSQTHCTFLI